MPRTLRPAQPAAPPPSVPTASSAASSAAAPKPADPATRGPSEADGLPSPAETADVLEAAASKAQIYDEEYKIWLSYAPYLYDFLAIHVLDWPSYSVEFLAGLEQPQAGLLVQRILLGTHTSETAGNRLLLYKAAFPDDEVQRDLELLADPGMCYGCCGAYHSLVCWRGASWTRLCLVWSSSTTAHMPHSRIHLRYLPTPFASPCPHRSYMQGCDPCCDPCCDGFLFLLPGLVDISRDGVSVSACSSLALFLSAHPCA